MKLQNFDYEITQKCGQISQKGYVTKELNVIRYGNLPLRYDLRAWETTPDKGRIMRKGVTLDEEEIVALRDLLNSMDLDEPLEPQGFTTSVFTTTGFDTTGKFV